MPALLATTRAFSLLMIRRRSADYNDGCDRGGGPKHRFGACAGIFGLAHVVDQARLLVVVDALLAL